MEDVECLQPEEKEENFREIRDEIEALKAIYNNNEEEEEEVKEDEKKVVVISREDFGKENESFTSSESFSEKKIAVTFSPTNRMILTFDGNSYPSRKAFSIDVLKRRITFRGTLKKRSQR